MILALTTEDDTLIISAAQCRAARALLDWNQDKLAESAHVGRATIADFERGIRLDLMRQNMISIVGTLEAAGVEFIPETEDGSGAGVRLRKVELQFSKEGRMLDGGILFGLRFRGSSYPLFIPRDILDDLGHLIGGKDGDRVRVASEHLGLIMRTAEVKLTSTPVPAGDRVMLKAGDFPPGTF